MQIYLFKRIIDLRDLTLRVKYNTTGIVARHCLTEGLREWHHNVLHNDDWKEITYIFHTNLMSNKVSFLLKVPCGMNI